MSCEKKKADKYTERDPTYSFIQIQFYLYDRFVVVVVVCLFVSIFFIGTTKSFVNY